MQLFGSLCQLIYLPLKNGVKQLLEEQHLQQNRFPNPSHQQAQDPYIPLVGSGRVYWEGQVDKWGFWEAEKELKLDRDEQLGN